MKTKTAPWDYQRYNPEDGWTMDQYLSKYGRPCPRCSGSAVIFCLPDQRVSIDCTCGYKETTRAVELPPYDFLREISQGMAMSMQEGDNGQALKIAWLDLTICLLDLENEQAKKWGGLVLCPDKDVEAEWYRLVIQRNLLLFDLLGLYRRGIEIHPDALDELRRETAAIDHLCRYDYDEFYGSTVPGDHL